MTLPSVRVNVCEVSSAILLVISTKLFVPIFALGRVFRKVRFEAILLGALARVVWAGVVMSASATV